MRIWHYLSVVKPTYTYIAFMSDIDYIQYIIYTYICLYVVVVKLIYIQCIGVANDGVLDDIILLFTLSCLVSNVCFNPCPFSHLCKYAKLQILWSVTQGAIISAFVLSPVPNYYNQQSANCVYNIFGAQWTMLKLVPMLSDNTRVLFNSRGPGDAIWRHGYCLTLF